MATRYRRPSSTERNAARQQRENERLRRELREDVMREVKNSMNQWMKQIEKELSASLQEAFSSSSRAGAASSASQSNNPLGGVGMAFANLAFGFLTRSRTKTSIETSAASETSRSAGENRFYRQSQSQIETAASLMAQKGQRGL